jgi:hypothetical protein
MDKMARKFQDDRAYQAKSARAMEASAQKMINYLTRRHVERSFF